MPTISPPHLHRLGVCAYRDVWQRMRDFTHRRHAATPDQIWLLQHYPVFTQGCSCHELPTPGEKFAPIEVVHSDRGGQMTYHGPGQLIAYLLLDIKRRGLGVKSLVGQVEAVVIALLAEYGVAAHRRERAPGVYVAGAKIAALGLRIHRGCVYHGLSLNVDMDLNPYRAIAPCGEADLPITQLREQVAGVGLGEVESRLAAHLSRAFDEGIL